MCGCEVCEVELLDWYEEVTRALVGEGLKVKAMCSEDNYVPHFILPNVVQCVDCEGFFHKATGQPIPASTIRDLEDIECPF